jgi:phosphoribosyl-AMP cyclohydrolase / phosphoribosyl-ATP pyrophosphohydrolase
MREYWARLLEEAKFGEGGLLPAVVQDIMSGDVLMVAYMSRAAMGKTIETGEAWFWSRSRKSLWNKGETSGNKMLVKRMALDCDRDTLLLQVEPLGPACHTGGCELLY